MSTKYSPVDDAILPKQNRNIEHLRAFAILMVLSTHFRFLHPVLPTLLWTSWSGVDLFFAISGYVIASSLARSLVRLPDDARFADRLRFNSVAIQAFLVKRFWRIVPPLLATFGLAALLTSVYAITTWRHLSVELLAAMTLTYNYVVFGGGPFTLDVLWSLAVEMQFYLLLPLFMLFFATTRKRLLGAMMIFVVVGAVVRPLHILLVTSHSHDWLAVRFSTHCRLDTLMAGVAVFGMSHNQTLNRNLSELSSFVIRGLLLVCIMLLLFIPSVTPDDFSHDIGFTLLALAGAGAVLLAVNASITIVDVPVLSTVLRYIGERSFSLYLVHRLTIVAFDATFPSVGSMAHTMGSLGVEMRAVQCLGVVTLTVVVAEVMYRWVEKPSLQLGRRLAAGMSAARAAHQSESVLAFRVAKSNHPA